MKKILSALIVLLCTLCLYHFADTNIENKVAESVDEQDSNLRLVGEITYPYQKPAKPSASFGINEFRSGRKIYSEADVSEIPFAIFDKENRLNYALTYKTTLYSPSYEENFYERNDIEHTCHHILYSSNVMTYDLASDFCYYICDRYMQAVEYWQFSETGNLISYLHYSPKYVGVSPLSSVPDGTVLYFNYGYLAEYDGEYLMSEILYRYNDWTYHAYQYDDDGNRTMEIVAISGHVTIYIYEYDEPAGQVTRYEYLVDEEYELTCKDSSSYSFYTGYYNWDTLPTVKKTATNGTVLTELYSVKTCDIGQQDYLIAEEIEETAKTSRYIIVRPGDSLWSIAEQCYGNGIYSGILYQANQNDIGWDKDMLLPGTRLYIPEIWSSTGDIFSFN